MTSERMTFHIFPPYDCFFTVGAMIMTRESAWLIASADDVIFNMQCSADMAIHVSLDLLAGSWLEFGTQKAVKQSLADIRALYFELAPRFNY